MIHWWTAPTVLSAAAALLILMVCSDSTVPYRAFIVIGGLIALVPLLGAVWLVFFLLSLI